MNGDRSCAKTDHARTDCKASCVTYGACKLRVWVERERERSKYCLSPYLSSVVLLLFFSLHKYCDACSWWSKRWINKGNSVTLIVKKKKKEEAKESCTHRMYVENKTERYATRVQKRCWWREWCHDDGIPFNTREILLFVIRAYLRPHKFSLLLFIVLFIEFFYVVNLYLYFRYIVDLHVDLLNLYLYHL